MIFMFASAFLLLAHMGVIFSSFITLMQNPHRRELSTQVFMHTFVVVAFLGLGLFFILFSNQFPNEFNWSILCFLAFGLTSILLFSGRLAKKYRSDGNSLSKWKAGIELWSIVAGIYICFTVIDHVNFFLAGDRTGLVNMEALDTDIQDMQCRTEAIYRIENDKAVYRCATDLVLARYSTQPFIPWPSYQEGNSKQLKQVIESLKLMAK